MKKKKENFGKEIESKSDGTPKQEESRNRDLPKWVQIIADIVLPIITGIIVPIIIHFYERPIIKETICIIREGRSVDAENTYTIPIEESVYEDMSQDYTLDGEYSSLETSDKINSETDANQSEGEGYTLVDDFKSEKYIVTFNSNGGNQITDIKEIEYGACYGELPIPTRAGYVFVGWYTDEIVGIMVTDKSIYRFDRDSTLYARWRAEDSIIYTVSFDANGGSCETENQEVEYGKTYGNLPIPSKLGSTFVGWYTAINGGKEVNSNSIYNTAGNVTLYARWEINSYTVKFDENGGICEVDEIEIKYGENYGKLPTPTRSGYNFEGWYTAISGGKKITSDSVYNISDDSTLYASWSNSKYIVTFNPNGGSCDIENKDVYYDKDYGTLPTASRTNYIFAGWYTSSVGGNKIESNSAYKNVGDITLYAHWNSIAVSSISISNKPANNTLGVGESVILSASVSPSDATNKSVTWSSSNTSVATVNSNGNVTGMKAGSVTITAKCDGKTEPVNLQIKNIEYGYDLEKSNINFSDCLYTPFIGAGSDNRLVIEFRTKDIIKDGQIFGSNGENGKYFFIVIESGKLVVKSWDGDPRLKAKAEVIPYSLKPNTKYCIQLQPWQDWGSQGCDYKLWENLNLVVGTGDPLWMAGIEVNKFQSNTGGTYLGAVEGCCDLNKTNANVYFISIEGTFVVAGSNYQVKNYNSRIVSGGAKNDGKGVIGLSNSSAVTKIYRD